MKSIAALLALASAAAAFTPQSQSTVSTCLFWRMGNDDRDSYVDC
jgi:hypothetical protein